MPDQMPRRLVVAFNFPPFTDGSAVTVAKRIIEADVPVDVISADLSSVRTRDASLWDLVSPWVVDHDTVKVPILFADERSLVPFVEAGDAAIRRRGVSYQDVYSRSMWPHSHFLAARLRADGNADRWTAEFSDPMLWHVDGTPRPSGPVSLMGSNLRLLRAVDQRSQSFLRDNATVLAWAQFIPFLLADELVFTNEQQLTVMLSDAPEWMRARVEEKAVISPHPTLGPEHYRDETKPSGPHERNHRYSIGYFGTFYPNRGGGEFLEAISLLPPELRERLELHIYTANAGSLLDVAKRLNISANVQRRTPLPFREFLRVSEKYDALLVNDIATSPFGVPSPFLPSKYSDYAGSSAETMAITIPGSPLDKQTSRWRAHVGDVTSISSMLAEAVASS